MPRNTPARRGRLRWLLALAALPVSIGLAGPAFADEGSIEHVDSHDGTVQVLYSIPGGGRDQQADLDGVELRFDGKPVEAKAVPASSANVRRTTMLAIDVSNSMRGAKFTAAKQAALAFLESAPSDVEVGIVTFAGKVTVLQEPSLDRASSRRLIDGLGLSLGTHLYDGLAEAARTSGSTGARDILVLSDGRDTSKTPLSKATSTVKRSGVKVDVIALAQSERDQALLTPLSTAGGGEVISADNAQELRKIFSTEAQTLANQVTITATLPKGSKSDGTLEVSLAAGASTYSDSAYVSIDPPQAPKKTKPVASTDLQAADPGWQISRATMLQGVLALGAALLVLAVALFGGLGKQPDSLESRIEAYTAKGATSARQTQTQTQTVTAQAVGMAQKALQSSGGFEARLAAKLDAGGLSLKPAEWLLLHAGITLAAALVTLLFTGGNVLLVGVGLLAGLVVPWIYLGQKQSRRLKAFNAQLAGTLQLLAGSLQAGLSVAQGMDTIVREGAEPVAGEFRRALVETRLGVQIEDALDSMAERMMSDDFKWTVMAIRIQREVGGNLADLLLTVAATLREREYLRRQVKSLSAEGRFSAYILLALPPLILLYEATTNPTYLHPLISTPMGFVMLGAMGVLMGLGGFMMQRMIKLEV